MNIFKSFEIFLREPLSILRDRLIQIVSVQSGGFYKPSSINAEFLDKKTQITVINSEKVYNLLQTAMYKQKIREEERNLLKKGYKTKKLEIRYVAQLTLIWTIINVMLNLLGLGLTKLFNPIPQILIESAFHEFIKPLFIQTLIFGVFTALSYSFLKNKKVALYGFLAFQLLVFHLIFVLSLKFSPIPFFVSSFSNPGLRYLSYNGQYLVDVLYRFIPINGNYENGLFLPLNTGKFYFHWIFLNLVYQKWLCLFSFV